MYAIVADVEKYREFLPWVTGARIARRISDCMLDCEMQVGFAGISQSYISRVTLDRDRRTIDVVQSEGPFRRLENHWRFEPRGSLCAVDFAIVFEFRSPLLNIVAGKAFERVLVRMTDAFDSRARVLSQRIA